ncbi:cytochrome oxidase, partial [Deinococcus sp. 6YEL10]|nr:cytochrome oxidase [Deinococcus sp. 6YEL10]
MTAVSLLLLLLVVGVTLWLVLEPLRSGQPSDPDAEPRARLEQDRDALYAELAALPDTDE